MAARSKPQTIDEYLTTVHADQRAALEKVRRAIRAAAPKAEEGFSYGMPAFRLGGKPIAAFAAAKNHCLYCPMSGEIIGAMAADLDGFETSKGAIRFQPDKPLSAVLIKKLVKARIAEAGIK